jgi:hypothetical protein
MPLAAIETVPGNSPLDRREAVVSGAGAEISASTCVRSYQHKRSPTSSMPGMSTPSNRTMLFI